LIKDAAFSRRPQLLLTNALDLVRTPSSPFKRLKNPADIQTNPPSEPESAK